MKKGANKSFRGFTIIEVALVLAIAGLIFLRVFIALPGLRASQRDAERRENVAMFLESVKKYQTNNRGALPTGSGNITWNSAKNASSSQTGTWTGFYRDYLGENFMDPAGVNYTLAVVNCGVSVAETNCTGEANSTQNASFPNGYKIVVVKQATCKGSEAVATNNPRKIAVINKLEGAGVYCSNT